MKLYLFFILFYLSSPAYSQDTGQNYLADTLPAVEINASKTSEATRFPLAPLSSLPLSAHDLEKKDLEEAQVRRLSDITRLDASTSDSYNASGYWDFLNVRGYTLDNRGSYLREGLPINAETSIPLDNKNSIEILKGLSGMQVGASSPGGMVNFTVLRPPAQGAFNKILTSVNDEGGYLLGADLGGRKDHSAYRGVLVYEELKPPIDKSTGQRYLVSYAQDFFLSETTLVQFEIENSRRSQPSQAGMSLLGTRIPDPVPRVNLNNQPWTTPVVFSALTATAGLQHHLSSTVQVSLLFGIQDLLTDDRLAYAYGCTAENNFDRFCSDGTFDVYDFRSNNEHRRTEAAKLSLDYQAMTGPFSHSLQLGVVASRSKDRFEKQAYNYVGVGNINGTAVLPEDPSLNDQNTQRDSTVVDVFAFDSVKFQEWTLWLGARSSSIERSSVRTDGSRPTDYHKNFILPWAALSYEFSKALLYASYGEGVEAFVTPNRGTYTNPGQFVDDVRSHQYEIGLRHPDGKSWAVAAFEIHRPVITDLAPDYQVDGKALHRGLEAQGQFDLRRWTLGASAMLLEAQRADSRLQSEFNGRRPVNVPKSSSRVFADYKINPQLKMIGRFSYEDDRAITADNSLMLSAWNRWDAGMNFEVAAPQGLWTLRLFVDNVFDNKFWKESPTQYGHIYLYPGQERTFTLDVSYLF